MLATLCGVMDGEPKMIECAECRQLRQAVAELTEMVRSQAQQIESLPLSQTVGIPLGYIRIWASRTTGYWLLPSGVDCPYRPTTDYETTSTSNPFRYFFVSRAFASGRFLNFRASTSHSRILPGCRAVMLPSWTVSVNGPA